MTPRRDAFRVRAALLAAALLAGCARPQAPAPKMASLHKSRITLTTKVAVNVCTVFGLGRLTGSVQVHSDKNGVADAFEYVGCEFGIVSGQLGPLVTP